MSGRFGKYGDIKRRLRMRKARRPLQASLQKASKKGHSQRLRPEGRRNA
jgi:hypothetical protein